MLQMIRAEAAERREQRERQQAAEERREAQLGQLHRYYTEHGEYPNDTLARQQDAAVRREEAAEARRALERPMEAEDRRVALIMSGMRPRTVAEVLAAAAGIAD